MSKLRSLSTSFWSDPFIEDLTPSQKLLFIYLITNEKTNMLGIYENSTRKMSFETGLNKSEVEKALKEFEMKGKLKYINNYVVLVNFLKHQNFNTNMKKSAIDIYNNLPKDMKNSDLAVSKSNPLKGFETLLNHYGMVSKVEVEYEIEKEKEEELTIEQRKAQFKELLTPFISKYSKDLLNEFYAYWTEKGVNDKKMRFEKEKSYDIARRLSTWNKNESKFNPKKENESLAFLDKYKKK